MSAISFKSKSYDITGGLAVIEPAINCDWVAVDKVTGQYGDAQSPQDKMQISFDGGPNMPLISGMIFPMKVKQVRIYNADRWDQSCTLLYGNGKLPWFPSPNDRSTALVGSADQSCGVGAITQLTTVNPSARAWWLSIPTASTAASELRLSNVSGNGGVGIIRNGPPFRMPSGAAVYAYNPTSGTVTVAIAAEY